MSVPFASSPFTSSPSEAQSIGQYINDYLDLVDNVPNEISRHVTELHALNYKCMTLMDKLEKFSAKFKSANSKGETEMIGKRIASLLIQMQEIADGKLKIAQIIVDITEMKAKELDADYEAIVSDYEVGSRHSHTPKTAPNKLWNPNVGKSPVLTQSPSAQSSQTNSQGSVKLELIKSQNGDKRTLPRRACAVKTHELCRKIQQNDTADKIVSKTMSKYKSQPTLKIKMAKYFKEKRSVKLPMKFQSKRTPSLKKMPRKTTVNTTNTAVLGVVNDNDDELKRKSSPSSSSSSLSSSTLSLSSDNAGKDTNEKGVTIGQMSKKNVSKKPVKEHYGKVSSKKTKSDNNKMETYIFASETIDPNEPKYCLCNQISYGDMICCDNDMCQIEWFHFPCVDLVHKPKGKWYCPNCRGDKSTLPKKLS